MARKSPGLHKRGQIWWIDKTIKGYGRMRESTGASDLGEAEQYLAHRVNEIRLQTIYGVRPTRTFAEAAQKYIKENERLRSLERSAYAIKELLPYIGTMAIDKIHNDALQQFKTERLAAGMAASTVNKEISVLMRILNLAAKVWRDTNSNSWLASAPSIERVTGYARRPRPISWDEQDALFRALPDYLAEMALFAVNTGLRQQEVCKLRWEWEVEVPELETSVFLIPAERHKNGQERLVILNRIAKSVIEVRRGKHREWVFVSAKTGEPCYRMTTSAWVTARKRVGLDDVRVHDLKHTFGHRLRAAGVSFEDRQDLLGHKSGRITTHYSDPDIERLIDAANRACERKPATVLRAVTQSRHNLGHKKAVADTAVGK